MIWTKFAIYAALVGSLIGILGGMVGTYYGIAKCKTAEQRSAMKKLAALAWLAVAAMVASILILPHPYGHLASLLIGLSFPWTGIRANRVLADAEQPKPKS